MTTKRKLLCFAVLDVLTKLCLYGYIFSKLSTSDVFIIFGVLFFSYSLSLFARPLATKMVDEEITRLEDILNKIKSYNKDDTKND